MNYLLKISGGNVLHSLPRAKSLASVANLTLMAYITLDQSHVKGSLATRGMWLTTLLDSTASDHWQTLLGTFCLQSHREPSPSEIQVSPADPTGDAEMPLALSQGSLSWQSLHISERRMQAHLHHRPPRHPPRKLTTHLFHSTHCHWCSDSWDITQCLGKLVFGGLYWPSEPILSPRGDRQWSKRVAEEQNLSSRSPCPSPQRWEIPLFIGSFTHPFIYLVSHSTASECFEY